MGSPFKRVTTDKDEKAIDRLHSKLIDQGFSQVSAVYRNPQDVAIAILALNAPDLKGDFALSVNTGARFCLVVARDGKDLQALRLRVDDLRAKMYPNLVNG